MPERAHSSKTVLVRFSEADLARLDRLAQVLTARAVGARVSRASAARLALGRGLDSLETELGITAKAKQPRKRSSPK